MTPELKGLYNISTYRLWKITFPYKVYGTFIFGGSKAEAISASEKLMVKIKHPYKATIKEVKI